LLVLISGTGLMAGLRLPLPGPLEKPGLAV
jgi:hypothetical protein